MHYEIIEYRIVEVDEMGRHGKSIVRKPKKKQCVYPNKAAIDRVETLYFKMTGKLLWLSWRKIVSNPRG